MGPEADAVMMVLMAECENDKEVEVLHEIMGHNSLITMLLDKEEEDEVKKVHRYFGHKSGRKVWDLFAKAGRLAGKKKAVLKLLEDCRICKEHKKTPQRPRVGMPIANSFNEVVGLDLKVLGDGTYILWLVDMFSRGLKGAHIKDKRPETIVNAIISTWIVGDGFGPGHPSKGFFSDNGGEFLNEELVDFAAKMDTSIQMTAARAPWQNGTVERNHASADIVFEKILSENPQVTPSEAIKLASIARNSEINRSGFSPLQLIMGKNPTYPGLAEVNPASSNLDSSSRAMKALKLLDEARVKFRQIDCDERIKKVLSQKVNPYVEKYYKMGDPVYFRDDKKKQWKKGVALVRFGKTLYLKYGNWLRRVPIDTVIPDAEGLLKEKESMIDPIDEDERGLEEIVAGDLEKDLNAAEENIALKSKVADLELRVKNLTASIDIPGASANPKDNPNVVEATDEEVAVKRSQRRRRQKFYGVFKKSSIHKDVKQLELMDGSVIEKNFETEVEYWEPVDIVNENVDDDVSDPLEPAFNEEVESLFPVEVIHRRD